LPYSIGILFLLSGVAKILARDEFAAAVEAYKIINSRRAVTALSFGVPFAEVVVGAGLCVGPLSRAASVTALGLLAVFTAAVAAALLRAHRPANCGCKILKRETPLGWNACLRNLGLACFVAPTAVSVQPILALLCGVGLLAWSFAATDADVLRRSRPFVVAPRAATGLRS